MLIFINIILCLLTGGLWLIPLVIYYLIKAFGGSLNFLDNFLQNKFTKNGKTKSLLFSPIEDYIDFYGEALLCDFDSYTNAYTSVELHTTSRPKEGYNLFSNVVVKLSYIITFIPYNSNSPINNTFEVIVYPNDNGVCDETISKYLSIKAKNIKKVEIKRSYSDGRVIIPPKIEPNSKIESALEEGNIKVKVLQTLNETGNEITRFKFMNEEGTEREFEVLFTYESEETNKHYVVYTDNSIDEEGNTKVMASIYEPKKDGSFYKTTTLRPITTKNEWILIENVLENVKNNN